MERARLAAPTGRGGAANARLARANDARYAGMKVVTMKTQRELFFSANSEDDRSSWLDAFEKAEKTI